MHVVWINERADLVGGAERYVYETAPLLAERGVRSTLLYEVGGWMDPAFTGRFDAAFPLVALEAQLEQLAPDAVYLHQFSEPSRVVAATRRAGIPTARFLHDHALFCPREHKYTTLGHRTCTKAAGLRCYPCLGFVRRTPGKPGLRLRTVGRLRDELAEHASLAALVVSSRYMRDHAVLHGLDAHRIHVNPLFVDVPERPEPVARATDELLFVGSLVRGKGLDLLLEALARSRSGLRLRVVGDGAQRGLFAARARALGVAGRVRFDGRLGDEALGRAYASATALVVPSRSPETFSYAGAEALARATPVIAFDVGGVREWLEPEVTGLSVPPMDVGALAQAIERLAGDPGLARRLGEAGRERVREALTARRHVDALSGLLRELAGGT